MRNFAWIEPRRLEDALAALDQRARLLAGGVDLLGELKDHIAGPERVINLKSISGLDFIRIERDGAHLGALATLTSLAEHAGLQRDYRALAEAAASVGTPQIRNQGTLGGNLCQRPRCWYYRSEFHHCLKKGGGVCFAIAGENKYHAILGGGPAFYAHPSDLAPALIALDARARIASLKPGGRQIRYRMLPLSEFFRTPAQKLVGGETALEMHELLTEVIVPPAGASRYLKFRERPSHDWALAACAAHLRIEAGRLRDARIVLGGVATVPWRAEEAEKNLRGLTLEEALGEPRLRQAGEAAVAGAEPLRQNWYKITLTQTLVRRAVLAAAGREIPEV